MIKVAISTISSDKINGVKQAFLEFFNLKESEIEFHSIKIESGVPEQPFDEETYQGAKNRVDNIKKKITEEMDFYISCEAGIESVFEQYFNVQVVCIFESSSQKYLWGKSAGWPIPPNAIKEVKQSNLDSYLRRIGITSIEELLGAKNSRSSAVEQATVLALASKKLLVTEKCLIGNEVAEQAVNTYANEGITQEEIICTKEQLENNQYHEQQKER